MHTKIRTYRIAVFSGLPAELAPPLRRITIRTAADLILHLWDTPEDRECSVIMDCYDNSRERTSQEVFFGTKKQLFDREHLVEFPIGDIPGGYREPEDWTYEDTGTTRSSFENASRQVAEVLKYC